MPTSSSSSLTTLFLHYFFLLSLFLFQPKVALSNPSSPYLSPSTFLPSYIHFLKTFKIYSYPLPLPPSTQNPTTTNFSHPLLSLFHSTLLNSNFLTPHHHIAHLFYLPLPTPLSSSPRLLSRHLRLLRLSLRFWNRSLSADHFFLSPHPLPLSSDRSILELKKNSIQISCFPTPSHSPFIPHKDLTLPPLPILNSIPPTPNFHSNTTANTTFLGFFYGKIAVDKGEIPMAIGETHGHPDFLIQSDPLQEGDLLEKISVSRFCLFFYHSRNNSVVNLWGIGDALRVGCVPAVVSGGPLLDLPFTDVLRWTEIAVFVGEKGGVRRVLEGTCGERYERMRELGKMASVHFEWHGGSDRNAFHTILYELWLRRHTINYSLREAISTENSSTYLH